MIEKTEQEIMKNWQGDKTKPVVSVCTITYNHEEYISEAIDSFLMQKTSFPFEIVIGEDCSLDGTKTIILEYIKKYPNIVKLITSINNVGMQKNGKRTMTACRGEYIAVCEGDDYWIDEKKLQIQIDEMKKYPKIDISFHPVYELKTGKKGKILSKYSDKNKIFKTSDVILGDGGFMPTNSLIFKKKIIKELPKWFYEIAPVGDYYLQIFAARNAGALYINQTMAIYRKGHAESWSHSMKSIETLKQYRIKTDICYNYLFKEFNNEYNDEIKTMISRSNLSTLSKVQLPMRYKINLYNEKKDIFSLKQKIMWKLIFSKPYINIIISYLYNKIK